MSSRDSAAPGASSSAVDAPTPLGGAPPTYAAFSPVTLSANTPSRNSRRSTVLVHQKSPLLLATPPQITRALAYSHPFLLPLNTFVGLLTWSTGDPWQSFLLLSAFWAVVLYGDVVLLRAGPIVLGVGFIAGMYSRRYSSLSSSVFSQTYGATKDAAAAAPGSDEDAADNNITNNHNNHKQHAGHSRTKSESARTSTKHQKTLDEIVETLREFTGRCNMLMDPLLEMTDFLSTQRTPTSATTKPALTAMFVRLLIVTPFWIALTMSPWRIITTRRVVLVTGTILLTWHSRVMRVTRAILWRSAAVRRLAAAITGLAFEHPPSSRSRSDGPSKRQDGAAPFPRAQSSAAGASGLNLTHRRNGSSLRGGKAAPSVKFTFIIYENQRRWVGLGWTSSLFAYERPAWTDEHQNGVSHKDDFELPAVEDGSRMRWRWAEGSRWRVDGVTDDEDIDQDGPEGRNGWIYYDNKWQNGKRGSDGWGRWTRRRKWYRDAELVEADELPSALELDATNPVAGPHTESYSTANEKMRVESPLPPRPPDVNATSARREAAGWCVDEDHVADGLGAKADDAAGLLTLTSRFWPLRRRAPPPPPPLPPPDRADRAATDPINMTTTTTTISSSSSSIRTFGTHSSSSNRPRERRAADERDATGLALEVELELQKQDKEGGQWGIGDEARMSLE